MADKTYKDFTAGSFNPLRILLTADPTTGELRKVSLPDLLGYFHYFCLLEDNGTSNPTTMFSYNTFTVTPAWSRVDVGVYHLTAAGMFPANKFFNSLPLNTDFNGWTEPENNIRFTLGRLTDNTIELSVYESGVPADGWIDGLPVEIKALV